MTNKELQKLGRRELLQLLLDQAKESERLGKLLKENDEHLKQLEESYERLRERLDKKDAQIHQLKNQLQAEKDKQEAMAAGYGGFAPPMQQPGQYPPGAQGRYLGQGVQQPGFQMPPPYQPPPQQPQNPYAGQYQPQPQAPDPFPYQVPPQGPEAYPYQAQSPDPFPYQPPYQEGAPQAPYPSGLEAPYSYPPPRPERKRQSGQHGKGLFRFFG